MGRRGNTVALPRSSTPGLRARVTGLADWAHVLTTFSKITSTVDMVFERDSKTMCMQATDPNKIMVMDAKLDVEYDFIPHEKYRVCRLSVARVAAILAWAHYKDAAEVVIIHSATTCTFTFVDTKNETNEYEVVHVDGGSIGGTMEEPEWFDTGKLPPPTGTLQIPSEEWVNRIRPLCELVDADIDAFHITITDEGGVHARLGTRHARVRLSPSEQFIMSGHGTVSVNVARLAGIAKEAAKVHPVAMVRVADEGVPLCIRYGEHLDVIVAPTCVDVDTE